MKKLYIGLFILSMRLSCDDNNLQPLTNSLKKLQNELSDLQKALEIFSKPEPVKKFTVQELINQQLKAKRKGLRGPYQLKAKRRNIISLEGLQNINDKENIAIINFDDNYISDIPSSIFKGFDSLEELSLSKNSIKNIQENAFEGLTKLTKLDLSHNKIGKIEENAFKGLNELFKLYLSYNQIESLPRESGLEKVQFIYLENNKLKSLDGFDKISLYHEVDLSNNNLYQASPESFKNINVVGAQTLIIRLKHNMLAQVPKFKNLSLYYLDLSDNDLGKVSPESFKEIGLREIITLNLQNNDLTSIPKFENIEIQNLDLSNNNGLKDIDAKGFALLKDLNLKLLRLGKDYSTGKMASIAQEIDMETDETLPEILKAKGEVVLGLPDVMETEENKD